MGKKKKKVVPFRPKVVKNLQVEEKKKKPPLKSLDDKQAAKTVDAKVTAALERMEKLLPVLTEMDSTPLIPEDITKPREEGTEAPIIDSLVKTINTNFDKFKHDVLSVFHETIGSLRIMVDGFNTMESEHTEITKSLHQGYSDYMSSFKYPIENMLNQMSQRQERLQAQIESTGIDAIRLEHTIKSLFLAMCERGMFDEDVEPDEETRDRNHEKYRKIAQRIEQDVMGVSPRRDMFNRLVLSHGGVAVTVTQLDGGEHGAN